MNNKWKIRLRGFKRRKKTPVKALSKFESFIQKYGDKNYNFNLPFRNDARFTCNFGLAEGYTKQKDRTLKWDSVRIHGGVDRSGTYNDLNQKILNEIYAPFDFDLATYNNYGDDHVYGSMLRLFNYEFKFEIRILHIFPDELSKEFHPLLKNKKKIKKGTLIAPSGDYGISDGRHTHVEIVSLDKTCEVLDQLLKKKYPANGVNESYTNLRIERYYQKFAKFNDSNLSDILLHYHAQIDKKRIVGVCNEYKYEFKDWYNSYDIKTKYNTKSLFNI